MRYGIKYTHYVGNIILLVIMLFDKKNSEESMTFESKYL